MSPQGDGAHGTEQAMWQERTRVFLTPIAPPSILGLYGFASATFMVAAFEAWGYGGSDALIFVAPFAAFFGGLAQFIAGMFSFRARDGVAVAMHGMWGAFWMAFGILWFFGFGTGFVTEPSGQFPELGYWFVTLSAITFMGAWAAWYENLSVFTVLFSLAVGAGLLAAADLGGGSGLSTAGGYVLIFSALAAFYTASALMLHGAAGKVVLPIFERGEKESFTPGGKIVMPIQYEHGEPGVKQGQ